MEARFEALAVKFKAQFRPWPLAVTRPFHKRGRSTDGHAHGFGRQVTAGTVLHGRPDGCSRLLTASDGFGRRSGNGRRQLPTVKSR